MDIKDLQRRIGAVADGVFGPKSAARLLAVLTNAKAPALTAADLQRAADDLAAPVAIIRAVRKVEAPRGAFDANGRPSILFERHKFSEHSGGRFDSTAPSLSGPPYGPGGYGSFAGQYGKMVQACALDPDAALQSCSWGAFQVLGENAQGMGYGSAFDMAEALTASEAAHLDCFVRFVRMKRLEDDLRACRPGDADSCIPFVRGYNGTGFRQFDYHTKLARAAL
jgi:hypothetical protein